MASTTSGMKPVISLALPTVNQLRSSENLRAELQARNLYETDQELARRLLRKIKSKPNGGLDGWKITIAVLQLVPNRENFCVALRTVMLWAKKRGINSNALGYFGGDTWAILMARTCQLYPNATASTLVQKLFLVFSHWKWPHPVVLNQPQFVPWNPHISLTNQYHLMPVITPTSPQQNSAGNVTSSTSKIIIDELAFAEKITEEILQGNATWDQLLESPAFFHKYRHFIVLLATATTFNTQSEWVKLVESRVRLFVDSLERDTDIALAHVNPKKFVYKQDDLTVEADITAPYCTMWFIGLSIKPTKRQSLDFTDSILSFTTNLLYHAASIGVLKYGMDIEARHVKRKNLSQYLDTTILENDLQALRYTVPLHASGLEPPVEDFIDFDPETDDFDEKYLNFESDESMESDMEFTNCSSLDWRSYASLLSRKNTNTECLSSDEDIDTVKPKERKEKDVKRFCFSGALKSDEAQTYNFQIPKTSNENPESIENKKSEEESAGEITTLKRRAIDSNNSENDAKRARSS